jgi:hypothetical protein
MSLLCHIPSTAKGASVKDTIAQRILYLGLPNQCKKCCRFGHLARAYTTNRVQIWEGNTSASNPPTWRDKLRQGLIIVATILQRRKGTTTKTEKKIRSQNNPTTTRGAPSHLGEEAQPGKKLTLPPRKRATKSARLSEAKGPKSRDTPNRTDKD